MRIIKRHISKPTNYLHDIINDESIFPSFHNAMQGKRNIIAMDIGCGFPAALIVLNEKYKLTKAICIDNKLEELVVKETAIALNKFELAETRKVSDFYFKTGGGCIKTNEEFYEIFSRYSFWGVDAGYALMKTKDKIDVLICQNFLHLWKEKNEWEHWLANFSVARMKGAVTIFRVGANHWFDYESFKTTLQKYHDGTMFEFFIDEAWNHSYFINLK